jgi:hypothetical protein
MRDYGTVSPRFWIGETGKKLRGDASAQVLAVYLMTSPHSHMTGVYHCPVLYMAHETGLGMEGASKALERLMQEGFCEYEEASETVFVVRMAAYQIGESLKPKDKRIEGLRREVEKMPEGRIKQRFLAVYGAAFGLSDGSPDGSPTEGAWEPQRSQEQEQEQEQEVEISGSPTGEPPKKTASIQTAKAERLKAVTAEAVETFNAVLGKPNGQLAAVHLLNEVRQNQVSRCVGVAREICQRLYGDPTIVRRFWEEYWSEIDGDPFKSGRQKGGKNHENWTPDFEYLTRKATMTAVFDRAMSERAA